MNVGWSWTLFGAIRCLGLRCGEGVQDDQKARKRAKNVTFFANKSMTTCLSNQTPVKELSQIPDLSLATTCLSSVQVTLPCHLSLRLLSWNLVVPC